MKLPALLLLALSLSSTAEAAPKWLKTLAEHVALGASVEAGTAYAADSSHPNWKAGITAAGAVALAKELTDLRDHKEKPKVKVLLDIGEILGGAGAGILIQGEASEKHPYVDRYCGVRAELGRRPSPCAGHRQF